MLKLSQLKKGDKFYIFDKEYVCFDHSVIECEVIQKFAKVRGYVLVNTLNHIYPNNEPIRYDGGVPFPSEIPLEAESDMFSNDSFQEVCEHRDEYVRLYEIGMMACDGDDGMDWYEFGKEIEEQNKSEIYEDCLLEIGACLSEEDYEETLDYINKCYSNNQLSDDECDSLRKKHHEENYIFCPSIDDYDWEDMKLCDPNLSDQ